MVIFGKYIGKIANEVVSFWAKIRLDKTYLILALAVAGHSVHA